jgi:hypothetical protein
MRETKKNYDHQRFKKSNVSKILFNERVMMVITHEDDFVSRAEAE